MIPKRPMKRERGVSLLLVLILLAVMLVVSLASVRMDETGALISGNFARSEAAVQASDVGVNSAFDELKALVDKDANAGGWYFAAQLPTADDGTPSLTEAQWEAARTLTVGQYTVRYVVDRQCNVAPVTNELASCLVRQPLTDIVDAGVGSEPLKVPNARVYRATVQVQGGKGSVRWVQALLTMG